MADETQNTEVSLEKSTFSSEENADQSSLNNSTLSNGNEQHPDQTETVQNGDEQEENNSSIDQQTENAIEQSEVMEETRSDEQNTQSSSQNQSVDNPEEQPLENSSPPSNVNDQSSDTDLSFISHSELQSSEDQQKPQRELDDDEIPPAEIRTDPTIVNNEKRNSEPKLETQINDDRPLTALETPFDRPEEETNDQQVIEHSPEEETTTTTAIENDYSPLQDVQNPAEDLLLSSTDHGNEGFEELNNELNQVEESLVEEHLPQEEAHFTEEDFPPLGPPQGKIPLSEEEYPPLPSPATTTVHQPSTNEPIHNDHQHLSTQQVLTPEREDILKNKTLFKQTLVEGIPNTSPTRSTLVTISYSLSLIDSLTSNTRLIENVSNEKFFVSENDLIPAIDICLQKMNRGERALIDSDIRHCYGEKGCEEKQIPPSTSLNPYQIQIELELHEWQTAPDIQSLTIEERLIWGDKKRQMGNFYYRQKDYQTALQSYKGALRFLDTDYHPLATSTDQNQQTVLNDRYIQVQNNVAQVNLLLGNHQACLNAVESVLKHDPKNVKALFRQGKALFELGKYDQAILPLKAFANIQKGNSSSNSDNDKVNEMISICENKLANYQKNEKEIYRRMFQPNSQQQQQQQRRNINNNQSSNASSNWLTYLALGSAVLATVGFVSYLRYKK